MLLFGGSPVTVWPVSPGAVGAPGIPPLIADDPPPMQGAPVTGLEPTAVLGAVVPGSVPGVVGDTGVSDDCGTVSAPDGFVVIAGGGDDS
jgi:hypothetical protein